MKFKKWMEKRTLVEADKRVITGRPTLSNTSAGLLGPGGVYGDPNRPSYGKQVLAAAGSAIGTSLADELGKASSIPYLQDPVGTFEKQKQSFDELPLQLPLINGKPIEGIRMANDKQNVLSILNNMLYINPRIRILTDSIDGGDKFEIYKEDEKTQASLREKFKSGDLLTIAKSFTTALRTALYRGEKQNNQARPMLRFDDFQFLEEALFSRHAWQGYHVLPLFYLPLYLALLRQ
jgi:hypothetical protein